MLRGLALMGAAAIPSTALLTVSRAGAAVRGARHDRLLRALADPGALAARGGDRVRAGPGGLLDPRRRAARRDRDATQAAGRVIVAGAVSASIAGVVWALLERRIRFPSTIGRALRIILVGRPAGRRPRWPRRRRRPRRGRLRAPALGRVQGRRGLRRRRVEQPAADVGLEPLRLLARVARHAEGPPGHRLRRRQLAVAVPRDGALGRGARQRPRRDLGVRRRASAIVGVALFLTAMLLAIGAAVLPGPTRTGRDRRRCSRRW